MDEIKFLALLRSKNKFLTFGCQKPRIAKLTQSLHTKIPYSDQKQLFFKCSTRLKNNKKAEFSKFHLFWQRICEQSRQNCIKITFHSVFQSKERSLYYKFQSFNRNFGSKQNLANQKTSINHYRCYLKQQILTNALLNGQAPFPHTSVTSPLGPLFQPLKMRHFAKKAPLRQ